MKRSLCLLMMGVGLMAARGAGAQAIPTAKGPDSFTAVGGGVALFESDYGQRLLGGGLLYTDINPEWRVGFEGEARYLRMHSDEDVTETNYLAGPRYVWRKWGVRPYAKMLFGAQRMTFPFKYAQGTFFTYAPGGGRRVRAWRPRDPQSGGLRVPGNPGLRALRPAPALRPECGHQLAAERAGTFPEERGTLAVALSRILLGRNVWWS